MSLPSIQRDTGSITADHFTATNVDHSYFAVIDGDVDFGLVYYTSRANDFIGNVDGSGSQTWLGGAQSGLQVERLSQSNTSILDVSSISFHNLYDPAVAGYGVWTQRDVQFNLSDRPCRVWDGWWDPTNPLDGGFIAAYLIFAGRLGAAEHKERSTLSLNPLRTSTSVLTGRTIDGICSFARARLYGNTGAAAMTCNVDPGNVSGTLATFPTCEGTPAACLTRSNLARFGGFVKRLKPNTTLNWGVQKVSL